MLKRAERKETKRNRTNGTVKGDECNFSRPSTIVFSPKRITNNPTVTLSAICFGNTKASVVVLRKKRGRSKRKRHKTARFMFLK